MRYIVAFDQGTTSSRSVLYDKHGKIVRSESREIHPQYPHPGWVEENPEEIWKTQLETAKKVIFEEDEIVGIGITNQRETTIVWDKMTGESIYPAIVWQCRRSAEQCENIKKSDIAEFIHRKTGLFVDAYFCATKIQWILDHVEGARERAQRGELLFGTVDTWLVWKLTGGKVHVTDVTNASRTMLFDIHTLQWDKELLELFHIPEVMMPDVCSSSEIYGMTEVGLFGAEIPIAGIAGDQQAALFGQGCIKPGDCKNTYGTGGFLLMNTGSKPQLSKNGLITTIAWKLGETVQYALEGSVFVAGAAVQWLRDELGIIKTAEETEEIARSVEDTGGVVVVPAFVGLGAPYWNPYVRGSILGITRGTSRAHIVRATLEAIAFQTDDVLQVMRTESGLSMTHLKIDGGAAMNGFLAEMQAGISDVVVERPESIETTSRGAAFLAGLAVGFYEDIHYIEKCIETACRYQTNMTEEVRGKRKSEWKKAITMLSSSTE